MANKTINQLTSLGSVDANDEFVLYDVSADATKKATKSTLLSGMQTELTFDDTPTNGSSNPVTSNGVFDFAFDKSKIRMGTVTGGSSDNDNWHATFDTPFSDNNYYIMITPLSTAGRCPSGWYTVLRTATGFDIFCKGTAPDDGFQYIAIHI